MFILHPTDFGILKNYPRFLISVFPCTSRSSYILFPIKEYMPLNFFIKAYNFSLPIGHDPESVPPISDPRNWSRPNLP